MNALSITPNVAAGMVFDSPLFVRDIFTAGHILSGHLLEVRQIVSAPSGSCSIAACKSLQVMPSAMPARTLSTEPYDRPLTADSWLSCWLSGLLNYNVCYV